MSKVIIIDPRNAGCSGDMFLSVFLDVLQNFEGLNNLKDIINKNLETSFSLDKQKVKKKSIDSTYLRITIDKDISKNLAKEIQELFQIILKEAKLSAKAEKLAEKMLNDLIIAESKVHGESVEKLHLHETASLDTILDIIGTVYLLDKSGNIDTPIYGLPVNVGSGFVTFSHGKSAVPPPAVLQILQDNDYTFFSDEVDGELLTPTGATMLTNLVTRKISQIPPVRVKQIGYGSGTKEIPSRSNVLRVLVGEVESEMSKNYLAMLETHLDDVTGEVLGGLVRKLLDKQALDVSYYPLTMKKNRPAYCLRVICEEDNSAFLAEYLMKEIGTLGVRESRFGRYELERRIITKEFFIESKKFKCRFKERILNNEVIGAKPEYEDMVLISEQTKIPIRDIESKLIDLYNMGDEYCE